MDAANVECVGRRRQGFQALRWAIANEISYVPVSQGVALEGLFAPGAQPPIVQVPRYRDLHARA